MAAPAKGNPPLNANACVVCGKTPAPSKGRQAGSCVGWRDISVPQALFYGVDRDAAIQNCDVNSSRGPPICDICRKATPAVGQRRTGRKEKSSKGHARKIQAKRTPEKCIGEAGMCQICEKTSPSSDFRVWYPMFSRATGSSKKCDMACMECVNMHG